jgi:hypothetical protein
LTNACTFELRSQKIIIDDEEILYGRISKEQLYFDFPEWSEEELSYQLLPAFAEEINKINKPVKVIIFLGTWCDDSKYNVPVFFKSVAQNKNINYELWAVDRQKKIENNMHEKYNLKKVPTFVFEINNREVGRIVENPQNSIEEDIIEILSKNSINN